jgi:AraC family transcriptional regulator, regulatory protein of adaptative response / methylated-DNA-[protein]-cysteine methyltransferase
MMSNAAPPTTILDARECWEAVQNRDRQYDGMFVYAVESTGIYSRPSCPARHPRRENVIFFATAQEADQAGFRPCGRCRPNEVDSQVDLVRRACDLIEAANGSAPTLAELGARLHVSPYHLQRVFKRLTGVTPRQYADARRLDRFKSQLKEGEPVTRALYDAGYGSSSRAYAGQLGMTPATYGGGGEGMVIAYAMAPCPLGYVLVAATARGICAVSLGDSPGELEAALASEYPAASIHRDDSGLGEWVSLILAYLDGASLPPDLPLDIQATAFQRRVWEALRAIPLGATRSYADIAASLEQPTATRAVAQACAHNPVAMVIPCHRVVRKNGDLGGYRWGVERKQALLEREQQATHSEEPA